ncbi:MAG: hypothetical protein VKP72_05180 [bacterium]|nr:hypothetical protein [bacterium]
MSAPGTGPLAALVAGSGQNPDLSRLLLEFQGTSTETQLKALQERWKLPSPIPDAVWQSLSSMLDKTVAYAPPARELVAEVVRHLIDAKNITQGVGTDSCTVTTLQQKLAEVNPRAYVRIVSGLFQNGSVQVRLDRKLDLKPEDFADRSDRRGPVSDAMQNALMRLARTFPENALPFPMTSGFFQDPGGASFGMKGLLARAASFGGLNRIASRGAAAGDVGSGLTANQFVEVYRSILGGRPEFVSSGFQVPQVPNEFFESLSRPQNQSFGRGVTSFLKPEDGATVGHAVRLLGVRDGMALLHDPARFGSFGVPKYELPVEDFLKKCEGVILNPS